MKVGIIISLCLVFYQEQLIVKVLAKEVCQYYTTNNTIATTTCNDECCSATASSLQAACCSSVSIGTLAIPFFVIAGICILGICVIYCRPLWKTCLCGHKCPCGNRTRVGTPSSVPPNNNPVFVLHNDDLPDYETITKDTSMKDVTPPPYNFVASHPNDFGIDTRVTSAPPQYHSRRSSVATIHPDAHIN